MLSQIMFLSNNILILFLRKILQQNINQEKRELENLKNLKLFNQNLVQTKINQKLVQIRDNLLPRLISGELQIPEEMLAS